MRLLYATIFIISMLLPNLLAAQNTGNKYESDTPSEELRRNWISSVEKINRTLAQNPQHPRRLELLLQKADLLFEIANIDHDTKRRQLVHCLRKLDKCRKPTTDYTTPLKLYRRLLKRNPSHHRKAIILYRSAASILKSDKPHEAMPLLIRLLKEHPRFERPNQAHAILESLLDTVWGHQRIRAPMSWLGIEFTKTPGSEVVVARVAKDSPADKYDLKPEDRITHINGIPIKTQDHARLLIAIEPPGSQIQLQLVRKSDKIRITVRVIAKPSQWPADEP